ncbi:MAG: phosphatase PAP2 family protein [Verrucomicrobiales bacterium]|nr:phosphatase PAP2 family protein [Verrucomicrobiales bacterium]
MSFPLMTGLSRKWESLLADLSAPPSGPRFLPVLWVALPLLLLAAGTGFVRLTDFDFSFQKAIYQAGGNSWALGDHPFWNALYRFGTLLPAFVILGSMIGLILGFSRDRFRKWRKVFLFCILLAITGPGVITNGLLKEYWGRPRPRHVEELGGHEKFEPILTIDRTSKGKSFPCGHATMGFYFLGGFFLFRRNRRKLAEGFLIFGLITGGVIGVARMAQGGHFFSDVIWAAAVCYFTAMGLYYLLRLDRGLTLSPGSEKPMPRIAKVGSALAGAVMLGGILVATPYRDERDFELLNDYAKEGDLRIHLTLTVGEADLVPSDDFTVTGKAYGHGVPTSQIAINYLEYDLEDLTYVIFQERMSGWFFEVDEQLQVRIPWDRTRELWLQPDRSESWLTLPESPRDTTLRIMKGEGEIHLDTNGQSILFGDGPRPDPSTVRITIDDDFTGSLFVDGEKHPPNGEGE